jgi:hypothetical protein
VAQTVRSIGAQGRDVTVKITKEGSIAVPDTWAHPLYSDVMLLGSGKTLTEITLSSFVSPVPEQVESALETLVSHRMGGAPTA